MPFTKTADVAQYKGADWSNFIKTVPNSTPQSAQRVAMADPAITFFFYCREYMVLEGKGTFNPGDAVFFSGEPWPGSAPQCDIYQKDFFNTAYVGVNSNNFANAGCYTLQDGRQFFDVACIFAANINADPNTGRPILYFNPQVSNVLNNTNDVATLQGLGITVLLTVLGNWENAGWSCFTDQATADDFAAQLAACVQKYGLDGIDIDDEYSQCATNNTSLIMVTAAMQKAMPGKIISKALFDDSQYFNATWNGLKLADTLTYGWEMTYGDPDGKGRLAPYVQAGMAQQQLAPGVWASATSPSTVQDLTQYIKSNNFGGMMVFDVTSDSADYLSNISGVLYNEPTGAKPNCLS